MNDSDFECPTMIRHPMNRLHRLTIALAVVALCAPAFMNAGCVNLSQPYQASGRFGLIVPETGEPSPDRRRSIRVSRVRVAPPANSRHFVYRMGETEFTSDYHNEFMALPERLLGAALVSELIRGGPFASVVEPGGTADADVRLETTVVDLHGDFRDLAAPTAVIRARFVLLEDGPATTRQIGDWTLERREPIPSPAGADLAAGYGRAWATIVDELGTALRPFAQ